MNPCMPPDVAAYLHRETLTLAEEKGFQPQSEEDMVEWMRIHFGEICDKALDRMQSMVQRVLTDPEVANLVSSSMAAEIHRRVGEREYVPSYTPRFLEFCKERNLDPAKAKEQMGGSMCEYIIWCNKGKKD